MKLLILLCALHSALFALSAAAEEKPKPSISDKRTFLFPNPEDGANAPDTPAHLFILSGQSNMDGLDPSTSFAPAIKKHFGEDSAIIVKHAQGSQSISRWHKQWAPLKGSAPKKCGDLYDHLMGHVVTAIEGREILSITFLWMQGERDSVPNYVEVYRASLEAVIEQLRSDLKHQDINVVIGRLSDAGLEGTRAKAWATMREIQVDLADSSPRFAWVDTDDLNNIPDRKTGEIKNNVHYGRDGYTKFGTRLAESAIQLIVEND